MGSTSDFLLYDESRYQKALQIARSAFWSVFAGSFPEIETGDLDPFSSDLFRVATENVTRIWMIANYPWSAPDEADMPAPTLSEAMTILRQVFDNDATWREIEHKSLDIIRSGELKDDK